MIRSPVFPLPLSRYYIVGPGAVSIGRGYRRIPGSYRFQNLHHFFPDFFSSGGEEM